MFRDEFHHEVGVALFRCQVEGCESLLRANVDEGLGVEQDVGQLLVAFFSRQVECRLASLCAKSRTDVRGGSGEPHLLLYCALFNVHFSELRLANIIRLMESTHRMTPFYPRRSSIANIEFRVLLLVRCRIAK